MRSTLLLAWKGNIRGRSVGDGRRRLRVGCRRDPAKTGVESGWRWCRVSAYSISRPKAECMPTTGTSWLCRTHSRPGSPSCWISRPLTMFSTGFILGKEAVELFARPANAMGRGLLGPMLRSLHSERCQSTRGPACFSSCFALEHPGGIIKVKNPCHLLEGRVEHVLSARELLPDCRQD